MIILIRRICLAILFIFFTSHCWGWSTEELYTRYKPYANNGFNLEQLSDEDLMNSLSCVSYFKGARAVRTEMCVYATMTYGWAEDYSDDELKRQQIIISSSALGANSSDTDNVSINAIIRSFMNYSEQNPKGWNHQPFSKKYLSDNWPCDTKKY